MNKLLFLIIITFLFISCKDDDKVQEPHPIVGEWQLTEVLLYEMEIENEAYKELVIKDIGNLLYSYKCEFNNHNEYFIYGQKFGTYTIKNDTLIMNRRSTGEDGYSYPYTTKCLFSIEDNDRFYLIKDYTSIYSTQDRINSIVYAYGNIFTRIPKNPGVKSVKIKEVYKRI